MDKGRKTCRANTDVCERGKMYAMGHVFVRTLDNASNTNGCLERPTARLLSRVELLALLVLLARLLEPAGVQHGDDVAVLGGGAVALDKNGLLDTHVGCGS